MTTASTDLRPPDFSARSAQRFVRIVFVVGLLLSLLMVWRSQVGGDQLNLLARGWKLYNDGVWISYGNPMSTGGKAPGGITSLLVGLPLFLWSDHRAATLLILVFHIAAYLLLDRTLRPVLAPSERIGLALLYWLNPWRLYFSAFLWNPNYLFLVGAIHLWSAFTQRNERRFFPSFLHAATLILAFQIHASFLLLGVASLLLVWRGVFRLHWPAAFLGGIVAALPLIPWAIDLAHQPTLLTEANKGFLGRGLLLVFPLVRGILLWFRYASLAVAGRMVSLSFIDVLGPHPWLDKAATVFAQTLPALTILLPLWAGRRFLRHAWPLLKRRPQAEMQPRTWLKLYAWACFLSAVLVFALSPTTTMMWQGLILLHAAILPLVLALGPLARTRLAPRVAQGAWMYLGAEVLLLSLIAFGSPQFRCQGKDERWGFGFALKADHPMLHELHIQESCPWPVGAVNGWFPDVLLEDAARAAQVERAAAKRPERPKLFVPPKENR